MNGDTADSSPSCLDPDLLLAIEEGNMQKVKELVDQGADICYQNPDTGTSILMVAARTGHADIVQYLLEEGAPWNAVDRAYLCAGDYAANHGHQDCVDVILNHAVMCELLLSLTLQQDEDSDVEDCCNESEDTSTLSTTTKVPHTPKESLNASYLSSRLDYTDDGKRLVDTETQLAVMMDWERPLMARHASWICHAESTERPSNLRVMNVGFGMGIVDKEIQKFNPTSHVIIEAHPEVLKKMQNDGWIDKPGVGVLSGRWQDVIPELAQRIANHESAPFDGIFFDTYAEDDLDLRQFHSWLPKLLRQSVDGDPSVTPARYSYYNGVCPDNVFFHGVACETIRLHLNRLGLDCSFEPISVDVSDPQMWKDLSQRYWYFDKYFLPKCTYKAV